MPMAEAVYIHPLRASDQGDFLRMVASSRALHHPWVSPPGDEAGFRELLGRAEGASMESRLVRRRTDDVLVGVFNIGEIVRGVFQSAYLAYYASAEQAGRGSMARGLRLIIEEAFGPLGLHRLEANIQPGNERSIALVRSAGFRLEGFSPRYLKIAGAWRDHERWAITAEDLPLSARPRGA